MLHWFSSVTHVTLFPFILATTSPSLFKIVSLCDELQQLLLLLFNVPIPLLLVVLILLFQQLFSLLLLQFILLLSPIFKQLLTLQKLHCENKQSNNADKNAITDNITANIVNNVLFVIADINKSTEKTISPTNIGLCTSL